MMWQLWQSGLLKNINGMVIGNLRRCEPLTPQPYDYSVKQVFAHYAKLAEIPVIYNLPVGHGPINGFLPLGVKAKIVADYNNPQLIITENYAEK
ncbi:MAG TPA: LD-carboxypeptidase, partial [Megamonas hypermegale]|nr:LD-carboxypeptidase [Megamonas hypermegale]